MQPRARYTSLHFPLGSRTPAQPVQLIVLGLFWSVKGPGLGLSCAAHRQAMKIRAFIQLALARAAEWHMPLFVVGLEICPSSTIRVCIWWRNPSAPRAPTPDTSLPWLVECPMCVVPRHGPAEGTSVRCQRGVRQGAPKTPAMWNRLLAPVVQKLSANRKWTTPCRWLGVGRFLSHLGGSCVSAVFQR